MKWFKFSSVLVLALVVSGCTYVKDVYKLEDSVEIEEVRVVWKIQNPEDDLSVHKAITEFKISTMSETPVRVFIKNWDKKDRCFIDVVLTKNAPVIFVQEINNESFVIGIKDNEGYVTKEMLCKLAR